MILSGVVWGKGTKEEPVCLKGRRIGGKDREGCPGHWTAGVMPGPEGLQESEGLWSVQTTYLRFTAMAVDDPTQGIELASSLIAVSTIRNAQGIQGQPLFEPAVIIFQGFAKTKQPPT